MASAIGGEWEPLWPAVEEQEVVTRMDRSLRVTPLQVEAPRKKRKKRHFKWLRSEVVDYSVGMREMRSVKDCAEDYGLPGATLSRWVREECKAYPEVADVDPKVYSGKIADYRKLLADLRDWSGTGRVRLSDYFSKSAGGWGFNREVEPATELTRAGHPYFVSTKKGKRRSFTEDQKRRTVAYWHSGFGGKTVKECARNCNVAKSILYEWIDEVSGCSSAECMLSPEISPNVEDVLGDLHTDDVEGWCLDRRDLELCQGNQPSRANFE
ncbi:MAG: transposase [Simkaniaceae bacterium]|nr:transposase [Simkaniaceae bacterium]